MKKMLLLLLMACVVTISAQQENNRDMNFVNPVPIGQAGNAIGFAFMRTTYLWADNNINAAI
jgi:hypothetical protein